MTTKGDADIKGLPDEALEMRYYQVNVPMAVSGVFPKNAPLDSPDIRKVLHKLLLERLSQGDEHDISSIGLNERIPINEA